MKDISILDYINKRQKTIDERLNDIMSINYPQVIYEAMRYSVFAGGKRLRPILCLLCYETLSNESDILNVLDLACAIELIHTYSLIHDDLPAMDNDILRRGKPTNHVVFGEDIAILAGDGLLNLAIETCLDWILTNNCKKEYIQATRYLFRASGVDGMIGGQVIDVLYSGNSIESEEILKKMHIKKTSRMIQASSVCGAIVAGASDNVVYDFEQFALNLGLAFQIKDDVLDFIGDEKKLGKTVLKDKSSKKNTYVTMYGIEKSNQLINIYSQKAIDIISKYDNNGLLCELTKYLIDREK